MLGNGKNCQQKGCTPEMYLHMPCIHFLITWASTQLPQPKYKQTKSKNTDNQQDYTFCTIAFITFVHDSFQNSCIATVQVQCLNTSGGNQSN